MAIVAWSTLYPEVMPEVPGCPSPMVDNAIRNAAIELCDFALMYRVDLTAIPTVADQATYALSFDADTGVAQIIDAYSPSRRLTPKTTVTLGENGDGFEVAVGQPLNYYQTNRDTVRIYPIPDDVYSLNFTVALSPTRAATGMQAVLMEQYRDELAAGALARLFAMSKKPWSDSALAGVKRKEFDKGMGEARIDGMRNFTMVSSRVIPRAFR